MAHYVFTSESVTNGHPDKVCDQVSDAVLDAILAQDPMGRVACETCCTTGMVMVMGEVTTTATVDIQKIAREVVCGIGYDNASAWFDGNTCAVLTALDEQSADIDMGVSRSFELKEGEQDEYNLHGAGDQGMMFGFACDETPEYMPMPISFARKLTNRLTALREDGTLPYLRPDGKSQVTVEYDENHCPVRVDTVVVSTQHSEDVPLETIRKDIVEHVIRPVIPAELLDEKTVFYVNPTGRFVIGGPFADCGVTGRKLACDTYGGIGHIGGGAMSGKDPSKVDRSGAYMARKIARDIVLAGYAEKCEVQIAYAIGVAEPVSVYVETFGTEYQDKRFIEQYVRDSYDLTPKGIIDSLGLLDVDYNRVSAYGHFGKAELPWEK